MSGMETLAAWVEETGSGMMMSGGQKSYGPGGLFQIAAGTHHAHFHGNAARAPQNFHSRFPLRWIVPAAWPRPAGGGRMKMDLADLGTVQVLDLLSPMDEIGVIAVDSAPHEIVPMNTVEKNAGSRGKILGIDSMGGGIFIYEALVAAARQISAAKSQTKTHHSFCRRCRFGGTGRLHRADRKASRSGRDH